MSGGLCHSCKHWEASSRRAPQVSSRRAGAPLKMSGGGWQEGELPGLPGGDRQGLPVGNHQSRGVSPPFTTGQPGGRSAYPEGQGDMQRFLEDVEASGKPRASTPSLSVSSGGSRGCTPPLNRWDGAGSSRSGSPSSKSLSKFRSSGKRKTHQKKSSGGDSSLNTSTEASQPQSSPPGPRISPAESGLTSAKSLQKLSAPSVSSSYSPRSIGGAKKKKSWVSNALNPTYRSRCDDLRRNFPGLPPNETLIVDYSCALQKDILVHGRLYVTTNFLCFYANIFRWETAVTIRWREVTEMKKEKTALVIPNAVQVCAGTDKFFFTSFAARDKTYVMLFRLWQNALLDSPASQSEIWSWVQAIYGEQQASRYNSDDPDASNDGASNYSYDGMEPPLILSRPRLCSNIEEDEEEAKLPVNIGSFLPDKVGDQPMASRVPTRAMIDVEEPVITPQLASTTDILTYEAWRQSKDAREIISRNFSLNIDDLFTLLFTNSKFFYDFQAERKTSDIVQCPWQHSDQSEDKFREVSYTLALNHAIGPKTTRATETQTMRSNSAPGHIYNVDVETTNADIPYADYFYVSTHYCIVKVGEGESLLTVLCDIKYKKTPWGLVKSFIEKNCWAGIEEHYVALAGSLDREVEARIEQEPGTESKAKKLTRRMRNQRRSSVGGEGADASGIVPPSPLIRPRSDRKVAPVEDQNTDKMAGLLVLLLVFLCFLNMYLVFKIWNLEDRITVPSLSLVERAYRPPLQSSGGNSWMEVLREQEVQHHRDLQNWKSAVDAASKLLQQTENTMMKLSQSFDRETNWQLLKTLVKLEEGYARGQEAVNNKGEEL